MCSISVNAPSAIITVVLLDVDNRERLADGCRPRVCVCVCEQRRVVRIMYRVKEESSTGVWLYYTSRARGDE